MNRTILLLAALVAAPLLAGPTPTPTATPVAGSTIGGPWDICAHITPAAYAGPCGYFVRSTKPQNPTERYNFQWKGGSNACAFIWQSFDNGVTQANISGCITAAGGPYSLPVCGNCVMGVSIATTPTPNASPISVIVTPSGDATIRVWRGTPTPTPTP